jgi:hypothetical protein
MDPIKKAIEDLIVDNVPAAKRATTKVKRPLLATADQPRWAEYADDFPIFIRCSAAKYRPDVISPNSKDVIKEEQEADEVYFGRWARFSIRPYFWRHDTGGHGVSLGLQNVHLLDHDEPIAAGKVSGLSDFASANDGLGDLE